MTGTPGSPDVELLEPGVVRVKCRKCHELIRLEFGNLSRSEAEDALRKIDVPRECPGFHVELSGWRYLWHFDEALDLAYPVEPEAVCEFCGKPCEDNTDCCRYSPCEEVATS